MINWWNRMTLSTLIVIKSPLLFFILGHLIHLIYSYFLHQKTATTIICIFCRVIRFRTFDWLSLLSFSSSKYIVVVMKNRKRTKFSLMRNLSKLISSISVNDSSSIFSATNSCHFSVMLVVARLIELIMLALTKRQTKNNSMFS